MANAISMTTREAIHALRTRGYSKRRISRELGIHRNTVTHCLKSYLPPNGGLVDTEGDPKCTIPTTGNGESAAAPSQPEKGNESRGRRSQCEPFRELIEGKLEQGLNATRIWRDLVNDHEFKDGYQSVKRYVAKLKESNPTRVWRMECEPGEEAQIDYGTLSVEIEGKRRKIHLLRVILSHSRKGYTEAMPRQDTESFIRGIENALRSFGGVPRLLVIDNLKGGVLKPSLYDPELNPKFASFCRHYEVVTLPTLPRTPEHKGKVERGVGYVKQSAVKGKKFASLAALNSHLRRWEANVADKRIHGTTKRPVGAHFEQVEKEVLRALPPDIFASFVEARRNVHRDGYVEFERSYYEAPAEYLGRPLWVRSDGRLVRLYNLKMDQVTVHPKLAPGQFSKVLGCAGTPTGVSASLRYWQKRATEVGPETGEWARGLVALREEAAMRVLIGLINQVVPKHSRTDVERACSQARLHGQYRLHEIKGWLENPSAQQSFTFLSEHEIIRDPSEYGKFVGFEAQN